MSDPTAPLTTAEHLKLGDVVKISVKMEQRGDEWWWHRFAVVLAKPKSDRLRFTALNLKMAPNLDRDDRKSDIREIDLRRNLAEQVVTWLPQDMWTQGIIAMHMKYVLTRVITIEGEE